MTCSEGIRSGGYGLLKLAGVVGKGFLILFYVAALAFLLAIGLSVVVGFIWEFRLEYWGNP